MTKIFSLFWGALCVKYILQVCILLKTREQILPFYAHHDCLWALHSGREAKFPLLVITKWETIREIYELLPKSQLLSKQMICTNYMHILSLSLSLSLPPSFLSCLFYSLFFLDLTLPFFSLCLQKKRMCAKFYLDMKITNV